MWLQNLLFLGTVVCSISAPTGPPRAVTRSFLHVEAIKEALSILEHSEDSEAVMDETVEVVSEVFNPGNPECLQTRLEMFMKGLRGSLTGLQDSLTLIASHYRQHCLPTLETSCAIQNTTFENFKEDLHAFLLITPLDCWKPVRK